MKSNSGGKAVRYNKWGYIFLIPFIVVFVIFQLVPLVNTIYNSFFENYMSGLTQVGPRFVGLDNYKALFSSGDIWTYFKNTMVLWIMCFIPQIFLSLLLGAWFSDVRLKLKRVQILQNSYLSAEPDYGICIFHVVLHSLFRWRTNQLFTDADRIYLRTL